MVNKNSKDSNILIRSKFILPDNPKRSWYESVDFSSYNGSKKTSYKSHAHYQGRKTEALVTESLNLRTGKTLSYADYQTRSFKVETQGHITREGIIQNKDLKAWRKKNPIHPKSPIWDMVISFREEYFLKNKILKMSDAERILKKTFNQFFQNNNFDADALSYMGAFHVDKPNHFHIHLQVHQTRKSKTSYKTGKDFVETRGKLNKQTFELWKKHIDYVLLQEQKMFQNFNLLRNETKVKVLGQLNDPQKVKKILANALWIKEAISQEGKYEYGRIKDGLVQLKLNQLLDNFIKNDPKTEKIYKKALNSIDSQIHNKIKGVNPQNDKIKISNLEKMQLEKTSELRRHLINQILKNLKLVNNTSNLIKNKFKNSYFVQRKIDQNNSFVRKMYYSESSFVNLIIGFEKLIEE